MPNQLPALRTILLATDGSDDAGLAGADRTLSLSCQAPSDRL